MRYIICEKNISRKMSTLYDQIKLLYEQCLYSNVISLVSKCNERFQILPFLRTSIQLNLWKRDASVFDQYTPSIIVPFRLLLRDDDAPHI